MALHVYEFLFLVCLLFSLALLLRLDWFPLRTSSSKGEAKRTRHPRLRHRHARQTIAPPVVSPPRPRRLEGQRLYMCVLGAR